MTDRGKTDGVEQVDWMMESGGMSRGEINLLEYCRGGTERLY